MATLEDFEDGVEDATYDDRIGDGWTVNANNRSSGFSPPVYRSLPDATNNVPPADIGGTMGIRYDGSSAWGLAVEFDECAGLGGYFFSDSTGDGGAPVIGLQVTIGFVNELAIGNFTVKRRDDELLINEFYDDLTTVIDNDSTVALSDFIDAGGGPEISGLWLEISFTRADGWRVRDATTGNTLASGAYPWAISPSAPWDLSMVPNIDGPFGLAGSTMVYADNIYGFAGFGAPFTRLFPRDDGLGMSGAPRIWPPPKNSNRVIGGLP